MLKKVHEMDMLATPYVLSSEDAKAMPEDAQYVLENCKDINGFYGASSMERLAVEIAIKEQIEKFKKVTF